MGSGRRSRPTVMAVSRPMCRRRRCRFWAVGISQEWVSRSEKENVLALVFTASGRGKLSRMRRSTPVFRALLAIVGKSLDFSVTVGPEAQIFVLPFVSENDYAPGKSHIGLRFGEVPQNVSVSDIRLVNYGRGSSCRSCRLQDQLPRP